VGVTLVERTRKRVVRQARLVGIGRSSAYYLSRALENSTDTNAQWRIDIEVRLTPSRMRLPELSSSMKGSTTSWQAPEPPPLTHDESIPGLGLVIA
jgi:hypothetical protein